MHIDKDGKEKMRNDKDKHQIPVRTVFDNDELEGFAEGEKYEPLNVPVHCVTTHIDNVEVSVADGSKAFEDQVREQADSLSTYPQEKSKVSKIISEMSKGTETKKVRA